MQANRRVAALNERPFGEALKSAAYHLERQLHIDMAFDRWPLFAELAVLPHGVRPPDPDREWAQEAVDLWRGDQFDSNIDRLRCNRSLPEVDTFDSRHITGGAKETADALWNVRADHDKVLAVLLLAWNWDQHEGRRRSSERELYDLDAESRELLDRWCESARALLGSDAPTYQRANRRVLAWHEDFDPITHTRRALRAYTLADAIVHDMWLSQTRARLVHLTRDPEFTAETLALRLEAKRTAREEQLQRHQREWEAQQQREEAAWLDELARRAERVRAEPDIDGLVTQTGAPREIIRKWARLGLSVEQIRAFADEGRRTTSRGEVDRMLVRRRLVPGVTSDSIPEQAERQAKTAGRGDA